MKRSETKHEEPRTMALTAEGREDQLIAAAMNAAEERILNGTASDSLLIHYLRLGSSKERLEKDIMVEQKKLITAKAEAIESTKRNEELYKEVINALKDYRGESIE